MARGSDRSRGGLVLRWQAILAVLVVLVVVGALVLWISLRRAQMAATLAYVTAKEAVERCLDTLQPELRRAAGEEFLARIRNNASWSTRYSANILRDLEADPASAVSEAGSGDQLHQRPTMFGLVQVEHGYRVLLRTDDPSADLSVGPFPPRVPERFWVDLTIEIHASWRSGTAWITIHDPGAPQNSAAIDRVRECLAGFPVDLR